MPRDIYRNVTYDSDHDFRRPAQGRSRRWVRCAIVTTGVLLAAAGVALVGYALIKSAH
jgi:hypothetical protein